MNPFFQNKIGVFLLLFFFIALADFALGGVTYFSLSIMGYMSNEYENELPSTILLGNLAESVMATCTIVVYHKFVALKIKYNVLKYTILVVLVYIVEGLTWHSLFYDSTQIWQVFFNNNEVIIAFRLNTVIAAALGFYFLQQEEKRIRKIKEQEIQLLEMQQLKTKAQLEALQAKVNPHFLYNSLNSIASLIYENPEKAEQMVLLLAKFFRYSTNAQSQYYTRLVEEIDMVKTYLEVEKVRFGERLEFSILLEDEKLKDCLIPQFLIQPLVENAVKHSIAKTTSKGNLAIQTISQGNHLIISIFDNGVPFPSQINLGYGLRSTKEKLELLGGENATMEILNEKEGKTIKITLEKRFEK